MSAVLTTVGDHLALASGVLLSGESLRAVSALSNGSLPSDPGLRAMQRFGKFLGSLAASAGCIARRTYSPSCPLTLMSVTEASRVNLPGGGGNGAEIDNEQWHRLLRKTSRLCRAVARKVKAGRQDEVTAEELSELRGSLQRLRKSMIEASLDASRNASVL